MPIPRTYISRTEFFTRFGMEVDPGVIGVCFTSPDGISILQEFVFTDEPYRPTPFLAQLSGQPTEGELKDIAELERMLKL